jgi:glycosyltransferase involved in cell wall biosynthesis
MKLRILVDGITFQNAHQRGVQRYMFELLKRIANTEQVDLFLSDPAQSQLPPGCNVIFRTEHFRSRRRHPHLRLWRSLKRQFAPTRFTGHSVFHSTFFTQSPEAGLPEVLTVHDLIPQRFNSRFHQWTQPYLDMLEAPMRSATKIICISHATAADLARLYPELEGKVSVVHHGADHFQIDAAPRDATPTAPIGDLSGKLFLLFAGDRRSYKNFNLLLDAMTQTGWPGDLMLVAVGEKPTVAEEDAIRHRALEAKVRFEESVTDIRLGQLIRHCAGFAVPALCEGFGFPVVEAQSLGAPVLCSDIPVFHEIGGEAAVFFDPENPAALAGAAARLLNTQRDDLIAAGFQNVKRFRWDDCARKTLDVYRSVAHV